MNQSSGFLVIDKPEGITSHDVVAKLRKRLGTKRVGHAGTLDPMATGVLVVGINNATKFLQYIVTGKKRYIATIRLGIATVTDDKEGDLVDIKPWQHIGDDAIALALNKFQGEIMQVPSAVSAKKISGERAYDLVREGKEVKLDPKSVTIEDLQILAIHRGEYLDVDIDVTCSAGTYIRAIARDLGSTLGVGGHLIALRRCEVAPFTLEDAGDIESAPIRDLSEVITKIMARRVLNPDEIKEIRFGRRISRSQVDGHVLATDEAGQVIAILDNQEGRAQPITVLNS